MAADTTPWLVTAALGLLGSGGLVGWLSDRSKLKAAQAAAAAKERVEAPANMTAANAELAKVLGVNFALALKGYQDQCAALTSRLDDLSDKSEARERQIEELEARIEDLERENMTCQSENNQLKQWAGSLTRRLRDAGIALTAEELPGSLISFADGTATVITAPGRKAP